MPTKTRWTGKSPHPGWSDPGNWTRGAPAAGIDARFTDGGDWSIRLGGDAQTPMMAGALIVQADTLTLFHGVLDLAPVMAAKGNTYDMVLNHGASVTIAAGASVNGSQVALIGAQGTSATLDVAGLIREEYGVVNAGTLDIAGGHWLGGYSGVDIGGGGSLIVQQGGTLDAGKDTFSKPASALEIGDNTGNGTATVTGAGSLVRETGLQLASGYGDATLSILDGAVVNDEYATVGSNADGFVNVVGAGSTWINHRSLTIGGQPPVASRLTIADGGSVSFGQYGFALYGTLMLDATATLTGRTLISGGAVIAAIPGNGGQTGTVTLGQDISLSYDPYNQDGSNTTYIEGQGGAALALTGAISGGSAQILDAASGHIILSNADNAQAATHLYAATLEIAASGAAGAGTLSFVGGSNAATLLIDAAAKLTNSIAGFAQPDTIDLAGLPFGSDLTASFTPTESGGKLTLIDQGQTAVLHFAGSLDAGSFGFADDNHGGTLILHH